MKKFCIVGLGLIGGSYAKALKKKGKYVTAIDLNLSAVERALKDKIIDSGGDQCDPFLREADCSIICLYPEDTGKFIINNQSLFKEGSVITDVSGVKNVVYRDMSDLREDLDFIGGHPMAGSEEKGYENSNEELLKGCNYIITANSDNKKESIEKIINLAKLMEAGNITVTTPEYHDFMMAKVSHFPHILSYCLKKSVYDTDTSEYEGRSFREMTRIAEMNKALWDQIFINNRENILSSIERFKRELEEYEIILGGKVK